MRGYLEQGSERFERPVLHGHWDDALLADLPDGSQACLWRKAAPPPEPTRYNLTAFAIELNEMTPGLEARAAPTDCRRRPDQHFLELGMYDQVGTAGVVLQGGWYCRVGWGGTAGWYCSVGGTA